MNQFFCNNCILLCRHEGDTINHFCKRLKNRFKKIEFIKDLSNNNIISPQTKYFWLKLFCKHNFLFIDNKTKYFCQINNKNGVVKTIIDDSTLIDIIKNEKTINITDKLDGLFNSNIITKTKNKEIIFDLTYFDDCETFYNYMMMLKNNLFELNK